jgi:hypothetical protein
MSLIYFYFTLPMNGPRPPRNVCKSIKLGLLQVAQPEAEDYTGETTISAIQKTVKRITYISRMAHLVLEAFLLRYPEKAILVDKVYLHQAMLAIADGKSAGSRLSDKNQIIRNEIRSYYQDNFASRFGPKLVSKLDKTYLSNALDYEAETWNLGIATLRSISHMALDLYFKVMVDQSICLLRIVIQKLPVPVVANLDTKHDSFQSCYWDSKFSCFDQ